MDEVLFAENVGDELLLTLSDKIEVIVILFLEPCSSSDRCEHTTKFPSLVPETIELPEQLTLTSEE